MTREDKTKERGNVNIDTSLPSLFVDDLRISIRSDDLVIVNFFSDTPEGKFEQTRIVTQKERLKMFIETLCKYTDYYPAAPVAEKEEEKKKKK